MPATENSAADKKYTERKRQSIPVSAERLHIMTDRTGLRIAATGSAVPDRQVTNNDLKQYMETDDEWIYTRTGIRSRGFCEEGKESCTTLAVLAAKRALEDAGDSIEGFSTDQIGAVLATTCSAEYMLPSIASMVQAELGLHREILAYDLNAACSGFVFGMITAQALMRSMGLRYVLLISTEQLSKQLELSDRSTGILFGDGAGAVLLELTEEPGCVGFTASAFSNGNIPAIYCKGAGADEQIIRMNGHEVFRFAAGVVPDTINGLLQDSGLELKDIDYILCHQANKRIIDTVRKKFRGYEEKFLMNIENRGNTSSASIPLLIDEMKRKGVIKSGMRLMCVGFGAGLAWGGAMINI